MQSPIQPGQFVVAGEEDGVFKEPPAPTPPPVNPPAGPLPKIPEKPALPSPPPSAPTPSSQGPPTAAGPNLSSFKPPQPSPAAEPLGQQEVSSPAGISQVASDQPDPTPFAAEKPQDLPDQNMPQSTQEPSSLIALIVVVLVLIAVIASIVWFFVLGKKSKEPVKTENMDQTLVEEPSPFPKRTTGGFADLPVSTSEAEESTLSAE